MKNRLNNRRKHGGGEKRDESVVSGQWSVVSLLAWRRLVSINR